MKGQENRLAIVKGLDERVETPTAQGGQSVGLQVDYTSSGRLTV